MKNIKELGLELIELEDQILLVEKINGTCGKWILVDSDEYGYFVDTTEHDRDYGGKDKNVIASTVRLEGLPLLVIEDESMINALNLIQEAKIDNKSTQLILIGAYTTGYNKAKEKFKFTEEDLKFAFEFGKHWAMDYPDEYLEHNFGVKDCGKLNDSQAKKELIKSLTKKELWVEVEEYGGEPMSGPFGTFMFGTKFKPNVSQGKIKAIWK